MWALELIAQALDESRSWTSSRRRTRIALLSSSTCYRNTILSALKTEEENKGMYLSPALNSSRPPPQQAFPPGGMA